MVWSEQPGLARRSCAAVHQRGDHMVEHDPVWHPAAVAAPGVGRGELGAFGRSDQRGELDPQTAQSGMLVAEARTLQVIIRTSAIP
jgi:hypothetical protein